MFKSVPFSHEIKYFNQNLRLETGLLARQATSSVVATLGETTVMANVVVGGQSSGDYFPLQVIYEEKLYASGKIKGSRFIKREGRPSDNAVLTGRMIDRSLRSLFDSHIRNEVQVIVTVLSIDEVNPPDILAVLAASSSLCLATKQFQGPVSSIRIGLEQQPLGQYWLEKIKVLVGQTQNFEQLNKILTEISKTLDTNDENDKIYIKEVARELAKKDNDWPILFSKIYKQTEKLPKADVKKTYPTKLSILPNPSYEQQEKSSVDLVVSGDGQNIMMVEAGSNIVDEETMGKCLEAACKELQVLTRFQQDFVDRVLEKNLAKQIEILPILPDPKFENYWNKFKPELNEVLYWKGSKEQRKEKQTEFEEKHWNQLNLLEKTIKANGLIEKAQILDNPEILNSVEFPQTFEKNDQTGGINPIATELLNLVETLPELLEVKNHLKIALDEAVKHIIQENILTEEKRIDGRKLDEVRQITCQIDVLPRVHGSSLFQRGETQVLNILTLGTLRDAQTLDEMEDFEETTKRYLHHYNFPPYSVGETGRYGSPGRREIGHGALAEKALLPVLPKEEDFPYTMRLVSECLGSNGSTSMASTCASCLSLMAGGVQISDMVAGVAMGLVVDGQSGNFKVLTDIQGPEDHHGDMDFKVTGTKDGITAIQLDNKIAGLTVNILKKALLEAKKGRLFILEKMQECIDKPRENIAPNAPRVLTMQIPVDSIGDVIGPSGRIIKGIIQKYDVQIDIEDDGQTFIYAKNEEKALAAKKLIERLTSDFQKGDVIQGKVFRIETYGAFVKILHDGEELGKEGLIHISNMSKERVKSVEDVVKMGEVVMARVLEVNDKGQISLTMK